MKKTSDPGRWFFYVSPSAPVSGQDVDGQTIGAASQGAAPQADDPFWAGSWLAKTVIGMGLP